MVRKEASAAHPRRMNSRAAQAARRRSRYTPATWTFRPNVRCPDCDDSIDVVLRESPAACETCGAMVEWD